jgi:alkylation response protein AidB-like acyl-CoA dehydrogenase
MCRHGAGIDAAALLVYRAAWTKDMGAARVTREAAMAKLHATETAQEVIDKAVQLHGGDGVRHGHRVEKPLPRDPGAAHLRGRLGRAEDRHRPRNLSGGS